MSDCCNTTDNNTRNKKHICPLNGKEYSKVPDITLNLHLKKPWLNSIKQQSYYFCTDPDCDVVYFGLDNSIFLQSDVRTPIGIKNQQNDSLENKALICYCFDVSYTEAREDQQLMQYVIKKTRNKECACDVVNPTGKCCLVEFKKYLLDKKTLPSF